MNLVAEKPKTIVRPFIVEVDTPSNGDLRIQFLGRRRLRGAMSPGKVTISEDKLGQEKTVIAKHPEGVPSLPGMQLHINPATLSYKITDPLYEDDALCDRIPQALKAKGIFIGKLRGCKLEASTLDLHRMKTLCREIWHCLKNGTVRMVKGIQPDIEDIDKLPGYYLQTAGDRIPGQPIFEKDYEKWAEKQASVET